MSLNIQSNVAIPQNQMTFRAKKIVPRSCWWLESTPEPTKYAGWNFYDTLIRKIKELKKQIKLIRQDYNMPVGKRKPKDLRTAVADILGQRFESHLPQDQDFRLDAAKDLQDYIK